METCFRLRAAVEHICTFVRNEEGPRALIPSLQLSSVQCLVFFLNFGILEGYSICVGVALTTLVNEMFPERAEGSDRNTNIAYRACLLVSSCLISSISQRLN